MFRKYMLFGLSWFSLHAFAGTFEYLPATSGAEKEFKALMLSGDYRHALMAWETTFNANSFAQSETGIATWAYILYKNGLSYTALETLLQSTQPANLAPSLMSQWIGEMKSSTLIQKGWLPTTGGWKVLVNNEVVKVKLKTPMDVKNAFAKAEKFGAENINEKARIWWQIATRAPSLAGGGGIESALKALKLLRESGQTAIGQDQISMTQGRVLYQRGQRGDLEAAIASWLQIPKSSSLWVEAVEEKAWAHLRAADYDHAYGDIATALSPALAPLAGPETYFLGNLMALRVCDYPRIFSNSETFKTRHRARLRELLDLANKGSSNALNEVLARFETSGVSQESAGSQVELMPRQLFRDSQFIRATESRRQLLAEIKKASALLEEAKTLGTSPRLERSLSENHNRADRFKQFALQRARVLAQQDLKEYRMVLNKMHIIEGEVIERLHLDDSLKGQRGKLSKNDDKGDVLVFPYTAEVWMDELDNYKARVKDCPTLKGASL